MNSNTVWIPRRTSITLYFLAAVVIASALWAYETKVDVTLDARGVVRPSGDVIHVVAEVGGLIERFGLKEGSFIHRGDTLVQLDTRELKVRRATLESRIDATERRLEQLRDDLHWNSDVESQSVDVDEFQDSAAHRAQKVELNEQQARYEQADRLFREGLLSRQAHDEARAALARAEADYAKWTPQTISLKRAQSGIRLNERQRDVDAARADVTDLYHQLDQCMLELSRLSILSPSDGQISAVSPLHPGESISSGAAIATIIPSGYKATIETWLPAAERPWVREGTPVRAHPEKILADDRGDFNGTVDFISPDARITDTLVAHRVVIQPSPAVPPLELGASFQLHFITRQDRLLWILFRKIRVGIDGID